MKNKASKTGRITPLKLTDACRNELELRKKERGINFIDSVENAILGNERFNSRVEREIAEYQAQHKCSRADAIEAMLIEVVGYRLNLPEPKKIYSEHS